jgi:DNA-binding MarR family transcriptional regulator
MYEEHLSSVNLTSTQFTILAYVDEVGAAVMKDLVEELVMERTSVIRALQPLERDGLLESAPHEQDTRKNVVRLTDAGRRKLAQALPVWLGAQAEFEKKFGADLAGQLRHSTATLAP